MYPIIYIFIESGQFQHNYVQFMLAVCVYRDQSRLEQRESLLLF